MNTFGFWVYTGPKTGGCEGYREPQWDVLLDDMAAGGMNALTICISCKYKGYRSRLPYLAHDQDPANAVIASDNDLVRYAIRAAHDRGIRVWVQSILNCYAREGCDIPIPEDASLPTYKAFKYDLDSPTVSERAVEQAEEIVDLFPDVDGLSAEFEGHTTFFRHRIPLYDVWAKEHGSPSYAELMRKPPNPRSYPYTHIRAYATWRTCECLREIDGAVRSRGFRGGLSTICACAHQGGAYVMETDMSMFRDQAPGWIAVTYDYDRSERRLAGADFNMVSPKALGIPTHFLGRGVMTWGSRQDGDMPVRLEEHWRHDFEDALAYGVDGLWMFEADAFTDGPHTAADELRKQGYASGVEARKSLLRIAGEVGVAEALQEPS